MTYITHTFFNIMRAKQVSFHAHNFPVHFPQSFSAYRHGFANRSTSVKVNRTPPPRTPRPRFNRRKILQKTRINLRMPAIIKFEKIYRPRRQIAFLWAHAAARPQKEKGSVRKKSRHADVEYKKKNTRIKRTGLYMRSVCFFLGRSFLSCRQYSREALSLNSALVGIWLRAAADSDPRIYIKDLAVMLFMLVLYLASLVLFDRVFYVFPLKNKKCGSASGSLSVAPNCGCLNLKLLCNVFVWIINFDVVFL